MDAGDNATALGLGLGATSYSATINKALQAQADADRQKMIDDLVAAGEHDQTAAEQIIDRAIAILAQPHGKKNPVFTQENRADRRRAARANRRRGRS